MSSDNDSANAHVLFISFVIFRMMKAMRVLVTVLTATCLAVIVINIVILFVGGRVLGWW
jgi:hypothetical protein